MSTEVKKQPTEGLFSKKNRSLLSDPLNGSNPVTVQVLGICSALAITVKLEPAIVMGLSVMAVTAVGNLISSLLRNFIPNRIRIIVQLAVVATLVTIVSEILKAFAYDMYKELSVFIGLIITNCIVMGRLEAFAMGNKPWPSFMDAVGNASGYAIILIIVAVVRELLGSGSLFGIPILGSPIPVEGYPNGTGLFDLGYMNNNLMVLPPMALIVVGVIIWIQRSRNKNLIESH
jgi:Na+-transporting NADH:ubiquinone oxidoreductase subunit D